MWVVEAMHAAIVNHFDREPHADERHDEPDAIREDDEEERVEPADLLLTSVVEERPGVEDCSVQLGPERDEREQAERLHRDADVRLEVVRHADEQQHARQQREVAVAAVDPEAVREVARVARIEHAVRREHLGPRLAKHVAPRQRQREPVHRDLQLATAAAILCLKLVDLLAHVFCVEIHADLAHADKRIQNEKHRQQTLPKVDILNRNN